MATGTPKIPAASITNTAAAMTRRGAAIASNAIRCSTSRPPYIRDARGRKISGDLFHAVNKETNGGFAGFIRRHYADVENPEYASQLARIGHRSRRDACRERACVTGASGIC